MDMGWPVPNSLLPVLPAAVVPAGEPMLGLVLEEINRCINSEDGDAFVSELVERFRALDVPRLGARAQRAFWAIIDALFAASRTRPQTTDQLARFLWARVYDCQPSEGVNPALLRLETNGFPGLPAEEVATHIWHLATGSPTSDAMTASMIDFLTSAGRLHPEIRPNCSTYSAGILERLQEDQRHDSQAAFEYQQRTFGAEAHRRAEGSVAEAVSRE